MERTADCEWKEQQKYQGQSNDAPALMLLLAFCSFPTSKFTPFQALLYI